MNSIGRISERAQYQIELGLQLCDSNELGAQLPFSIGKPLVNDAERPGCGAASNRARSGRWRLREEFTCLHDEDLQSQRAYARAENDRCAEQHIGPLDYRLPWFG